MEYGPNEAATCLESMRPKLGRYAWMWRILRVRIRQIHCYPHRLHALLRRFGNPERPYFIGTAPGGVRFIGDYRDSLSAVCASDPTYGVQLTDIIVSAAAAREGAYVDMGANLGVLAAGVALRLGPTHPVIAFEPVPETASRAAATFALNGLDHARLFQMAVGETDGEIAFYSAPGYSDYASAFSGDMGPFVHWQKTCVPCRPLDALVKEGRVGRVAFIKADVEGFEPQAVRGARDTIARDHPPVVYEYNEGIKAGWQGSDVASLLQTMGRYRCHVILDEGLVEFTPPHPLGGVVNVYCEPVAG